MRKPGRGALYYCSSEQGTPRGVERTTWLSRGFTGAISTPFFYLKTKSAWGPGAPSRRPAAPFPKASPRANGPALPPALWLRNPQSAIRNPQSVSGIRNPYQKSVSYFFLQGGCRAFLWQGLFAIRKTRTSVNPYLKSVIRIMNP